jgi:hypothetical protein
MASERKKCHWFEAKSKNPDECMHYRNDINGMCDCLEAQTKELPNEDENLFN